LILPVQSLLEALARRLDVAFRRSSCLLHLDRAVVPAARRARGRTFASWSPRYGALRASRGLSGGSRTYARCSAHGVIWEETPIERAQTPYRAAAIIGAVPPALNHSLTISRTLAATSPVSYGGSTLSG
jgi:hypothetical protein